MTNEQEQISLSVAKNCASTIVASMNLTDPAIIEDTFKKLALFINTIQVPVSPQEPTYTSEQVNVPIPPQNVPDANFSPIPAEKNQTSSSNYPPCDKCGAERVLNPKTNKVFCSKKCWL